MTQTPAHPAARDRLADALARLGRLLLGYGCATHRLERALAMTAAAHGWRADVFGTPTGLWMSLGRDGMPPAVRLVRVERWGFALDRLGALDEVFNALADGRIDVAGAHARMDAIEASPPRYGAATLVLAGGLASGSAAVFFRAGWLETGLATVVGLVLLGLTVILGRGQHTRLLMDFAAGLVVGLAAWAVTAVDPSLPRKPLILAGLIVNVPGLGLTAGLAELGHKNLVSGTARLLDAGMVMLSLLFGVGAIAALERLWTPQLPIGLTEAAGPMPPLWLLACATTIAAASFVVLFSVARADAVAAVVGGFLAWGTALAADQLGLGGAAAAFFGALATGLYANVVARWRDRPAQIYLVPAIVLLVPGAFGFASFERLLWGDISGGLLGATQTVMIGAALAIGLLLANALAPPRKVL